MTPSFAVLVDSDAFVGRFYPDDAHFRTARSRFSQLEAAHQLMVTTNLVVAETATVLSNRSGQSLATRFLDALERGRFPVIHVDEALHQQALELFKAQVKRGTSVIDCTNVVVLRQFAIPQLFSFDKFYRQLGIEMVA